MPPTDPFYAVKDDIQESLDKAQAQHAQWQGLGRTHPDRRRLETDIEDECKSISWQVDEMEKAVDVAEKNMSRYGLDAGEIASRRRWVQQTRRQCDAIVASVDAARRGVGPGGGRGAELLTPTSKLGAAVHQENDGFLESEGERQQLLLRQQDDELDELGTAVTRIGQVGLQIHEELGQQAVLLDELDEDIEGTQNRLAAAQKKIATVLERAGLRTQLCLLVFLIVLLVILCLIAFS